LSVSAPLRLFPSPARPMLQLSSMMGAVHHMFYPSVPGSVRVVREVCQPMPRPPRLLDRVRPSIRARHYSRRTEKAYVAWVRRYILFHGKRHPSEMGAVEMTQYLSSLAGHANVSASTQNQALSALLFLYREVLGQDLPWLDDIVRAKRTARLPVVLSRDEVRAVLRQLRGTHRLMSILLYGAGRRLLECARLRVKDVDFARNQVIVRAGKGDKDRATPLPSVVRTDLVAHLAVVRRQHDADLRHGAGWVELPWALARKYPTLVGSGRGSGFSQPPVSMSTESPVSDGATTSTNPCCSARSRTPYASPASPSAPRVIRCATRSPPTPRGWS
jgi:integrase